MSKDGQIPYRISNEYASAINRTSALRAEKEFTGFVDISKESPLVKICIQSWQKALNRYREVTTPNTGES